MHSTQIHKWMKRGGLLFVLTGAGCLILALVVVIAERPLQGMVLPPYGMELLPPAKLGPLTGWELDAALCVVVGLSGVIGGLLVRRAAT